jgi:hypothetical protein
MTHVLVVEQYGGTIGNDNGAIRDEFDFTGVTDTATTTTTSTHKIDATKASKDKCLAVELCYMADNTIYEKLLEDLENDYTKGSNNYPSNVTSSYNLLVNYKNYQRSTS